MAYSLSADMVRLHVIAANDTTRAQRLKMRIVKSVRKRAARLVFRAVDAREAFQILSEKRGQIESLARRAARLNGYWGPVAAECGLFEFPDRVYGKTLVPAGQYKSVRVKIGEGGGRNWWCVLYPELCAVDQSVAEVLLNSASVEFFSAIGDFLSNLFHGVGL